MTTRRQFLKTSTALTLGTSLFGFQSGKAANTFTFDLHAHPGAFFYKGTEAFNGDSAVMGTLNDFKTSKISGAFFSLVADMKILTITPDGVKPSRNFSSGEAWTDYKRQLKIIKDSTGAARDILLATRAGDLDQGFKKGNSTAFIGVEGGDYLEGDAGKLEEMYNDGIRSVQIMHYHPNELGDLQTEPPQHNGLSGAGKDVVKRMNKLGILIDVAHATTATTQAVANTTDKPIILSHSMLRVESDHPIIRRTISKEHAKLVAQTGGAIGMWPCGLNKDFNDFVDNTMRLIDAVGIDHVGLGTDMDANFRPVLTSYLQVPDWLAALRKKGLSEEDVTKVAGGNVKRILDKVLK
jgi:membrane dipeptidase